MEQSWDSPVTGDEIEVANILLELPPLIFESESRPRFSLTWGASAKRKRSTAAKQKVAGTSSPALELSPAPAQSLPSNFVVSTCETEAPMQKVLTSSPATTLSLSPCESDEKPMPSKKKAIVNSLDKKKEQLLETTKDFTLRNELLKKDIENKKRFLDQQKSENLELKAKKQKLSLRLRKAEEPRLETSKSLNLEIKLTEIPVEIDNCTSHDYHHQQRTSTRDYQQPLIMDQTVYRSEMSMNSQYPVGRMISCLPSNTGGLRKLHDNVGPLGVFDLNVSAEEALDFSFVKSIDLDAATKARAAEARLKRKQIWRSKNYNAACKVRNPCR